MDHHRQALTSTCVPPSAPRRRIPPGRIQPHPPVRPHRHHKLQRPPEGRQHRCRRPAAVVGKGEGAEEGDGGCVNGRLCGCKGMAEEAGGKPASASSVAATTPCRRLDAAAAAAVPRDHTTHAHASCRGPAPPRLGTPTRGRRGPHPTTVLPPHLSSARACVVLTSTTVPPFRCAKPEALPAASVHDSTGSKSRCADSTRAYTRSPTCTRFDRPAWQGERARVWRADVGGGGAPTPRVHTQSRQPVEQRREMRKCADTDVHRDGAQRRACCRAGGPAAGSALSRCSATAQCPRAPAGLT